MQQGYKLVARLIKFVGKCGGADISSNDYRLKSSGEPVGLLTAVGLFKKAKLQEDVKETKKLLFTLESGSSSALKAFQEVLVLLLPIRSVARTREPTTDLAWLANHQQITKEKRELEIQVRTSTIRRLCGLQTFAYGLAQHDQEVADVVSPAAQDLADTLGLKISVTGAGRQSLPGHSHVELFGAVTPDVALGKGSEQAWADLQNDLQAKLITRLKTDRSHCRDFRCSFCRSHQQALSQ